jgi:hypothetical protein
MSRRERSFAELCEGRRGGKVKEREKKLRLHPNIH